MRLTGSGLCHGFAGRAVLDGVDVTVEEGESLAVTGPSGMGKTTLLAILGGLLAPDEGVVRVDDGDASEAPDTADAASSVAWVHQTTNVLNDRRVLDNVALGCFADRADRSEARSRARDALATVGLADRDGDWVRVLSGGEVQRVVIARAIASRRPFLLADEPTGQLDSRTSRRVVDALLAAASDRGVVIVTHDDEVARRCDRVLRLREGRLQDAGRR